MIKNLCLRAGRNIKPLPIKHVAINQKPIEIIYLNANGRRNWKNTVAI